ncbi:TPA: peptidylprolyl isomerase [Candidatus Woesearchaeota archaeon]|nr:Peptidyl-prolyl cis-trans isomerase [archaeon GW2011_AR15]MBS3103687.1 peptidylprolyl isomerase [Candidatus Woesearchaeota archaeon]HIH41711.1 peptidylprolyl isomerase [Candidatus Woesearchaeota archaeon]
MAGVKEKSKVKFHYTGKLNDGEVFDSSLERAPLEFVAGSGMIIPGLEREMLGMKKGEKKVIKVIAKEAYGESREELVRELPKGPVPEGMELKAGAMIYLRGPDGQPFPAKILEVKDATVVLDLNHPLAGQDLTFEVEIVGVE